MYPAVRTAGLLVLAALITLAIGVGCSAKEDATAGAEEGRGPDAQADGTEPADSSAEPSGDRTDTPLNVRALNLRPTQLHEYLVVSGVFHPVRGTEISTEESGVVAEIQRDKGTFVDRGNSVLVLDRRLLRAQKESAEAAETLRKFNEEKTRELFDQQSVSGQEMLIAHTQFQQATAEAEIARLRYQRAAIKAPFHGVVADRFVELGQLVGPGTRVARIVDPFTLELDGSLTEREVRLLSEGSTVEIELEGVEGPVKGIVHWIGFEADTQTGKFPIEIRVDNEDLRVRPGVLGRARVPKRTHDQVIAIPRDSIVETSEGKVVFLVDGDRARRQAVMLGEDQGLMVIVRDGLEAGDQLIVRGQRELGDGSPIIVQEETDSPDGSLQSDPPQVRADDGARARTDSESATPPASSAGGIQ